MLLVVVVPVLKLEGMVGAWESTVTVVVAVVVPKLLAAVIVYIVVVAGLTLIELTWVVVLIAPGLMLIDVELETFQDKVEEVVEDAVAGLCVKELMVGADPAVTIIVVCEVVVPYGFTAVKV